MPSLFASGSATLILFAFQLCAAAAFGEVKASKPAEITLSSQEISSPALKYRLLPMESELKPGNAATILLRLPWDELPYFTTIVPKLQEWADKPLDDPAWKDPKLLTIDDRFYGEMKRAAYRRTADWEYPWGEEPAMNILLPDLQGARQLVGFGLMARIRYHLGRGEIAEAREGVLVGLAVFRHYARTPFLVCQFASVSNCHLMCRCVEEMISLPGSPNLYWALTALPRPLFDLRPSLEVEQVLYELSVAGLDSLERTRSADEWREMCDNLVGIINEARQLSRASDTAGRPLDRAAFTKESRRTLSDLTGIPPADVAAMSDSEVFVRGYMARHVPLAQRAVALMSLPPTDAIPALVHLKQTVPAEEQWSGSAGEMLPAWCIDRLSSYVNLHSIDRRLAALCVIEALRHHLATHDGKLPENLSEIDLPGIPPDPFTGKPFAWSVSEGAGHLSAEEIKGVAGPGTEPANIDYVIRVRPKGQAGK